MTKGFGDRVVLLVVGRGGAIIFACRGKFSLGGRSDDSVLAQFGLI